MSIDSAFQNMIRGGRIPKYMGIMDVPAGTTYGPDYIYLQIPFEQGVGGKKGQTVSILLEEWAAGLRATQFPLLVKVNPALQTIASAPSLTILDPGENFDLSMTLRKDVENIAESVSWAVRVYLMQ